MKNNLASSFIAVVNGKPSVVSELPVSTGTYDAIATAIRCDQRREVLYNELLPHLISARVAHCENELLAATKCGLEIVTINNPQTESPEVLVWQGGHFSFPTYNLMREYLENPMGDKGRILRSAMLIQATKFLVSAVELPFILPACFDSDVDFKNFVLEETIFNCYNN